MRVLLLLLALAGCHHPAPPPPPAAPPPLDPRIVRRDEARLVLERFCGECHIGTLPTALPKAIAVFDLSEMEFATRMTPDRWKSAMDRLVQKKEVSDEDRRRVRAYVEGGT